MMKLYDVIRKEQLEKKGEVLEVLETDQLSNTVSYNPPQEKVVFQKRKPSWKSVGVLAVCFFGLVVLYVLGMKLVHARIVVSERHIPFSFDKLTLDMEEEKVAEAGRLTFQAMVVTTEVTRQVYASGLQPSNTKASGSIVFFNEYSTKAITIKKGTTVTAANGKKYITQEAATIPGYTTVNKLKSAGTSAQVNVTALEMGEAYNTEGTSFTVSGYNQSQVYARSTGAIRGGDAGVAHVLTEADRESAVLTLQADLVEKLKRETRAAIPAEYVTFPNLQLLSVDRDSLVIKGTTIKFPASMKGTMVSYLIHRDMLESAIAAKLVSDNTYPDVSIPSLADVTVEPLSAIPTSAANVPESLTISLSGQGILVTKVPVEKIRQSMLGISRKSFNAKISAIPEIEEARYTLYPFWAPFFPSIQSRINVVVK